MGGSGGYGRRASYYTDAYAEAAADTDRKAAEAEVNQIVNETLERINQVDREAVNRHKDTVLGALDDCFDGAYDLRGGGSYTRRTYVSGLSDVDVLLDLGNYDSCDIPNKDDPAALLAAMEDRLQQRLPNTELRAGRMAVTVSFSDGHELQILPAFRERDGYRIPDPQGEGWRVTRPRQFAQLLDERSAALGGGLRRCIRLAKVMCANEGIDVRSYHLENMAIKAFDNYAGIRSVPAMLRHFFNQAKTLVMTQMRDVTGQETHVDGYLTETGRNQAARKLQSVESKLGGEQANPNAWRELLAES